MPVVQEEFYSGWTTIEEMNTKVEQGITEYENVVDGIRDTYEKVRIVYDKLINDVNYAYKEDGETPEDANWAHSIIGVFDGQHHAVVWEGYAKVFSFLMNVLEIPNVYIVDNAQSGETWGGHAWNAVSFDTGKPDQEKIYYYLDSTWDDQCGKNSELLPENCYIFFLCQKPYLKKGILHLCQRRKITGNTNYPHWEMMWNIRIFRDMVLMGRVRRCQMKRRQESF